MKWNIIDKYSHMANTQMEGLYLLGFSTVFRVKSNFKIHKFSDAFHRDRIRRFDYFETVIGTAAL